MAKTLYIGFDIGDAETIINFAQGDDSSVQPATMPGRNQAGIAIPTMYGYTTDGKLQLADSIAGNGEGLATVAVNFKRCPSDIINADPVRKVALTTMKDDELWRQPEMNGTLVQDYCEKLNTFIKIILTHERFEENARAMAKGCTECKVCVGHPTRWTEFDIRVYQALLRKGILGESTYLGLKLTLNVESESRAAFLYIRDAYKVSNITISGDDHVGLLDIGSSTLDVSVIKGNDSRNCVYNDGHVFLGARSIDYLILEYCLDQLKTKDPDMFHDIFFIDSSGRKRNPSAWDHALINCRFAKEALFSSTEEDKSRVRTRIDILDFDPVRLNYTTLVDDICERPVADVLRKYCNLTEDQYESLGKKSWKAAFEEFLKQQKLQMKAENITLSQVFFTGSASRMSFVKPICAKVFPEMKNTSLLQDTNPSNAIANGLARVGVSSDTAAEFVAHIRTFIEGKDSNSLTAIIERRIPDLISDIAEPTVDIIKDQIMIPKFRAWQAGKYKTVNAMVSDIEATIKSEALLNEEMLKSEEFQQAIQTWLQCKLGNDIGTELSKIATEFKVRDFSLEELNTFAVTITDVTGKKKTFAVLEGKDLEIFGNALMGVVGIISYLIVPYVIAAIITLIGLVSESVFWSMIIALYNCPEPVVTTAIAAIAALLGVMAKKGFSKQKGKITAMLNKINIPIWARKKVSEQKLLDTFDADNRADIVKKIKEEMNSHDNIQKISQQIKSAILPQVKEKTDKIKYVIENR